MTIPIQRYRTTWIGIDENGLKIYAGTCGGILSAGCSPVKANLTRRPATYLGTDPFRQMKLYGGAECCFLYPGLRMPAIWTGFAEDGVTKIYNSACCPAPTSSSSSSSSS